MKKLIAVAAVIAFVLLGFHLHSKSKNTVEEKMHLFLLTGATISEVKSWLTKNEYSFYTYTKSELSGDYISDIREPGLNLGRIGAAIAASSKNHRDTPPFRQGVRLVLVFDESMKLKHYKVYE